MTQKDIQLLLKDLSARLPYGVMCQVDDGAASLNDGKLIEINISRELARFDANYYWDAYIDDVKPYLHPMSSMTEEEKKEYIRERDKDKSANMYHATYHSIDWLLAHHFDYRGLIKKGLALQAPKDMYK